MVLTARVRRRAFNFAKAISIGLAGRGYRAEGIRAKRPWRERGLAWRRRFMGRQIVQDYDIARPKSRSQLSLDVSFKNAPVHRRVNDKGGGQRRIAGRR